jgi:hypothetical protein
MTEINLRHEIRDLLKPGLIQQVENVVGPGTPDTYYSFERVSGWIELKVAREVPKRSGTAVFKSLNRGLEVEQEAWLYQAYRHGNNAFVLCQLATRYFMLPGFLSYSFNKMHYSQFDRFELRKKDLRAILISYAAGETIDTRSACTSLPQLSGSVWYAPDLCDFRQEAAEIYSAE